MKFKEYLNRNLENPEFCKEYFSLEAEYSEIKQKIANSINKSKKRTYLIVWSQEDNTFIARCAEFPSLAAHGETAEKALKEIEFVISASFEQNKTKEKRKLQYAFT